MTLSHRFLTAAGSVTGRAHRRAERDGQDGFARVANDDVLAAIVTDGCSSGARSDVGARVGAAWLAALVAQRFGRAPASESDARSAAVDVTRELLARLRLLARSFDAGGDVHAAHVDELLLFTFLAAVVTPTFTLVFGIGDGLVLADGTLTRIDPGPRNAPPYVAYALLDDALAIAPTIHLLAPTGTVSLVAVATDGLEPVHGALPALVGDPRYDTNPSLLRKRLVVLSDQGAFDDDATLALIRRRGAS